MSPLDVAIVGAGPAGISAGIWAHTLKLRYAIFEAASAPGGQLHRVFNRVVDYPGVPAENGAQLGAHLRRHAENVGVSFRSDAEVSAIYIDRMTLQVDDADVESRYILLATGVRARSLEIPGEAVFVGRGVSPSASLYAEQFRDRRVLVVGGGDAAFEEALILSDVCEHVTLMHRSATFKARHDFRERVAAHPRIELIEFGELLEIEGADRVERARLLVREVPSTIDVQGVFICAGVVPNSDLVAGQVALDGRGYVSVNAQMQSTRNSVYAVGDVRSGSSLTIAAAVGEAATAIKDVQRRISRAQPD